MKFFPSLKWAALCLCCVIMVDTAMAQNAPAIFNSQIDSLALGEPYNAKLPLFESTFSKNGVAFPQPFGASVNIYYGIQDVEIQNMMIGLDGGELSDLSGLLDFGSYTESAQTASFKADAWVLPFLNVYGMVGITNIESEIKLAAPTDFKLNINTKGSFVGYGAALASVVGPVYLSANGQAVHTFAENQDHGDISFSSGVRVGPVFHFKNKPKRTLIVWVGGLYTNYVNASSGAYNTLDLFPQAQEDINREIANIDNWYAGLNQSDQALYQSQYDEVRNLLTDVSSNVDDTTIDYSLDRRLEIPWNIVLGAQYQLGPRFFVEGEMQFLGSRTAGLVSVNYRFGSN